ncbi:MAG: tRNA (adenosine(37)-N6)-threonylcarbamoyltransferase complex ATPase subunit type 1 TsaE, partial [Candidatus Uhrbacteria bacterium]
LGVRGRITSPTFVLMRVHRTDHRTVGQENHRTRGKTLGVLRSYSPKVLKSIRFLVHADAYRVSDPRELLGVGIEEWIGRPDAVVVIEWGERLIGTIRYVPIVVRIADAGRARRTITIIRAR